MLRSFQYTEKSYLQYNFQNSLFREKELEIAEKYVRSHFVRKDLNVFCPICNQHIARYFFTKWGVDYLRCSNCKSIFAVCDETIVHNYKMNDDLIQLRLSDEFQKEISVNRENVWREFLEWIEVRAFRFLGRNRDLSIIDIGNRYRQYSYCMNDSNLCGVYDLRQSILGYDSNRIGKNEADIVFYLDQMQQEIDPVRKIREFRNYLKKDGILVLNTRAGSGFDIISLKEHNEKIYPYEHILLPSVKGLITLLNNNGYKVLEATTPGVMDVKYVMDYKTKLDNRETFINFLFEDADSVILQEFQRFLQKGCLSSFVCVIARKENING